ncbi:mitochondrial import receptor subunit TOM40 homolog 1-like [Drosophila tropicalis]|uniref:mitochondrial import receptor subunit TOM40 homolog 1-like n=1 Tax=Drosophila tropicalis TaxID=46794 RepID=UPI0035AB693A
MGNAFGSYPFNEKTEGGGDGKKYNLLSILGIRTANDSDDYELRIYGSSFTKAPPSAAIPPPAPPPPPPPAPTSSTTTTTSDEPVIWRRWADQLSDKSVKGNPGTVADLHRLCRDIQPVPFDGVKIIKNNPLNDNFGVGHAVTLSQPGYSSYQLNVSYTGDHHHIVTGENFPVLTGEIDAKGNLTATITNYLSARIRSKFNATLVDSEIVQSQLTTDYLGNDFTFSLILSNVDLRQRTGVIVASYLQEWMPPLSVGVELIYQTDETVPGGQAAVVSAVARYQKGNKQWSGSISLNSLELCYSQTYGKCLRASVEMQADILKRQAVGRLAYHCTLPKAQFNFRGCIDTRGVISGLWEKRLEPFPMLWVVAAKMNQVTDNFLLGIGLVLD